MKAISPPGLILILSAALLTASCAKPRVAPHLPPENLPQIDGRHPGPSTAPSRPAIMDTMISKAEKQLARHQPEAAFQTLERALTVDGRDPMVWHLMARVRQVQGQFGQAETLARKSNTLARGNPGLIEMNRQIIALAQKESRVSRP